MDYQHLKCITPIDGRYKDKVNDLSDFFSELSFNKYRILIEIEYLISLGKLEIYDELDCVSKSYKPVIRFREFADSSINFFIYFQGKNFGDHNTILNSYIKKLHKKFLIQ